MATPETMEPHSSPAPARYDTFRLPQALVRLLKECFAGLPSSQSILAGSPSSAWVVIKRSVVSAILIINPFAYCRNRPTTIVVGMVKLTALCGIGLWIRSKCSRNSKSSGTADISSSGEATVDADAASADPGLLKKHSSLREYSVPATGFSYPAIRTFYRPHPQEQKLPQKPTPVPLLVFIHGLGGCIAQFHPILLSLTNLASCLAIDLPGCGLSAFAPQSWDAYTTDALVHLLAVVIEAHRDHEGNQEVVLVGHSMGCSLAALLASPSSQHASLLSQHVCGLVAICPKANPPTADQVKRFKHLTRIPAPLFNLFRILDRRGGVNSPSVTRMVGEDGDEETKKLQLRFNMQSRTEVWMRMTRGLCPDYTSSEPQGGLPGQAVWSGLDIPVCLVAGEADIVTPPQNINDIMQFLGRGVDGISSADEKVAFPAAAAPFDPALIGKPVSERKHQDSGIDAADLPRMHDKNTAQISSLALDSEDTSVDSGANSSTGESATLIVANRNTEKAETHPIPGPHPRRLIVKPMLMPRPAAHSLLFAPHTSRILSGKVEDFLCRFVDSRLSLAWQLQYLTTEGKWDVKNLEKWKAVAPVSAPIANTFRAMKTLREVDEKHSPKAFVSEWSSKIFAVVDISHDTPVYDPKGLENGGITYHKFPTVSKQPPTRDEVRNFIELIDKIQATRKDGDDRLIGVHCHYGFNRTGFFLVSYMMEKLGYRVEDAIQHFRDARHPGIRHDHFLNELHIRYCSGLNKAPTL